MRRREWIKTVMAAAGALALMLFLGNREAVYNWIEALVYIAVLAGGFYGGFYGGIIAGGAGGLIRWYVTGGDWLLAIALAAGGICCAVFRQLGKGASCMAFLSGTAIFRLLLDIQIPSGEFQTLLVALIVFLVVSPERRYGNRKYGGRAYGKVISAGSMSEKPTDENAAAAAPQQSLFERKSRRGWNCLADHFTAMADCFEDQSVFLSSDLNLELSAAEWKQRFLESRQTIRLQFLETGEVIRRHQACQEALRDVTEEYEAQLRRKLRRHHIRLKQLQILEDPQGRQEIFASLACEKGVHVSAQETAAFFYTEMGKRLIPAYDCCTVVGPRTEILHLVERPCFQVLYGIARNNKEGNEQSGDSFSARMLGEDRMLLCLADGMGTGKRAGLESEMTVDLLEQFLENDFSLSSAVCMTNQILLNWRRRQTPTTLDICLINLYSGSCQFAKMGAAASYLKRGTGVSAIRGQTVPLGILSWEGTASELSTEEQLQSGDLLIMMTDGVQEKAGLAADEILKDLISRCTMRNARELAEHLMEQVLLLDNTVCDDMTILAAGIWKR